MPSRLEIGATHTGVSCYRIVLFSRAILFGQMVFPLITILTLLGAAALGLAVPLVVGLFAPDARIPYWLTLPAMLIVGAWSIWVLPPNYLLPCSVVLGWVLLTLAIIDGAVLRLPNAITYPLIAMGVATTAITPSALMIDSVIGAAAGFAALGAIVWGYARLRGHEGLGLGDAKLAAAGGAWLGWMGLPSAIVLATLGGMIVYLFAAARRGSAALREPIPFGIPLCFAIWLVWLYGPLPALF